MDSGLKPVLVQSGHPEGLTKARELKHEAVTVTQESKSEDQKERELDIRESIDSDSSDNEDSPDIWKSVMACHRLVLSQTPGIQLMVVPARVVAALGARIREEALRPSVVVEVLEVARAEHAFLLAKECIAFLTDNFSQERVSKAQREGNYPGLVFTAVQVDKVKLYYLSRSNSLLLLGIFRPASCHLPEEF